MLHIVGVVADLKVVDLGCGEGRFCRMLAERGAETLGVDLQAMFITNAEARKGPRERYEVGDIQHLDGVASDSFDFAIAYITLVDVPNQLATITEAFRVLRPGGRYICATCRRWRRRGPITVHGTWMTEG